MRFLPERVIEMMEQVERGKAWLEEHHPEAVEELIEAVSRGDLHMDDCRACVLGHVARVLGAAAEHWRLVTSAVGFKAGEAAEADHGFNISWPEDDTNFIALDRIWALALAGTTHPGE